MDKLENNNVIIETQVSNFFIFQKSIPNQTKFISIKLSHHMKLLAEIAVDNRPAQEKATLDNKWQNGITMS